jgi:hypothetical protein
MYETSEAILFFFVFLSQVVLISGVYPRRIVNHMRRVLEKYPPSTHPKLYPLPVEYYERRLRNFARLNLAVVVAGLLIIVGLIVGTFGGEWDGAIVTPWSTSGEWDAAIVTPFLLVQVAGIVYLALSGRKHDKAMAQAAPPRVRTTELRPRKLFDFISPAMLIASALINVAFIAFVLYYRRFEFPWFTAAGNIIAVTAMNLVLAACVGVALRARRFDFYQAHQDRLAFITLITGLAVMLSIAIPVATTVLLLVKLLAGPDFLEPVVASLHVQIFGLGLLWLSYRNRGDKVDFDVYKRDARDSTAVDSTTIGSPQAGRS